MNNSKQKMCFHKYTKEGYSVLNGRHINFYKCYKCSKKKIIEYAKLMNNLIKV